MRSICDKLRERFQIRINLYFIFGLFIVVSAFFILGQQKDIWFCDEVYTYMSANVDSGMHGNVFSEENKWITGESVVEYLSANERNLNFKSIADNLFTDHVPLYFFLFRICSILFIGSCSKWVGLSLNLVFFLILYGCVWKFLDDKEDRHDIYKLIAVLTVMLHSIVLSEALTIRMYLMFSLAQLLFLLILDKKDYGIKRMSLLCAVSVFGMLTHFYFWIWLAFFSIIYLIYLLVISVLNKSKLYSIVSYIVTMLSALVISTLIFPNWIKNIFFNKSAKGNQSLMKIMQLTDLKKEFMLSIKTMCDHLFPDNRMIIVLMLLVLIIVIHIYFRRINYKICLILISSVIYAFFVQHTQPSVEGRYLWSSSVLIYICFVIMLLEDVEEVSKRIKDRGNLKFCIPVCCLGCLLIAVVKNSINTDNIFYLRNRANEQYQAIKECSDIPWIVFHDNTNWVFLCSMYDFTIPQKIKRCGTETPAFYDSVIESSSELIIYTVEENKSIEECLRYVTDSSDKEIYDYEQISQSYAMSVYRVMLQD